jgi:hypothetical protein
MKKNPAKQWLTRLHRNDRGNMGTLLLLTIFALVGILALVWNSADIGTRRENVQTAADSTAHSSAVWMSRTLNAVAAQNMVMSQDASAETIWRAVPAADTGADVAKPQIPGQGGIRGELTAELALAQAMKKNPWLGGALQLLQKELADVYDEEAQTQQALGAIAGSYQGNMPDPQTKAKFAITLRQSAFAIHWIDNTYMGGNDPNPQNTPPAKPLPGPPRERDSNGNIIPGSPAGLAPLVSWVLKTPPAVETKILDLIISFINTYEMPVLVAFEQRTQPATSQAVDTQMDKHEQTVYDTESKMVDGTPDSIEAQRANFAKFYRSDVTLATVQNDPTQSGPAKVPAPCVRANTPDPMTVTDTISGKSVVVDPINPQTNNTITGDARIIYPDPTISIPMVGSYVLKCNVPGGWGHIWAMPVERYYNDRVWNDQQTIRNTYMVVLDNLRNNNGNPLDLRRQIELLLNVPLDTSIDDLPGTIPDCIPDPTNNNAYDNIFVLPALTAPATSSAKFRTQVDLYNQHAAKFTGAVRRLRFELLSFVTHYDRFTRSFAVDTWSAAVSNARDYVVEQLGTKKRFMVLSTYKLRYVPADAQAGMRDSAALAIADQIVEMNISTITQRIVGDLINSNPNGLGGGILDPTTKQNTLYGGYISEASQLATAALTQAATPIGQAIAQDWVSRPWPYEITPPADTTQAAGIGDDDRRKYFTVIAGARENAQTPTHLLLPKLLGITPPTLFAYAQAESFNWMEFNNSYGGKERFDQVTTIPYGYGYNWQWGSEYIPCPRGWRLSTIGGWNWQPRLAMADAVGTALPNNTELGSYFTKAGVTVGDQASANDAIEKLNNH